MLVPGGKGRGEQHKNLGWVNGIVLRGRCHLNASAIIKGLPGPNFKVIILRNANFPWDQPWEYAQEEGEIYDFDYRKIPMGMSGESAGPREPILNVGNGGQKAMNQTSDV
ncbi:hypothetical protein RUM44_011335 [Polyplax serrata]|uniref:Uncharacterized protein n=1 Tax=Polyplax serrata TaxID=468196 RepID=A0ABR1APQ8_POLSC